jgi:hypothetical protein
MSNEQKKTSMHKGGITQADNPENRSSRLTPFCGIVPEITKKDCVLIELADGFLLESVYLPNMKVDLLAGTGHKGERYG